jgi:HAD superfamily PSPase-like hydrolase
VASRFESLKHRLVAFDLDGTLTTGDPSWVMLHRRFGTVQVGVEGERLYSQGRISYRDFMLMDVRAWPKPLTKSMIEVALKGYSLRPEAERVISGLKDQGVKTALVTAALDPIAEEVGARLGLDLVRCNRLGFDKKGFFDGNVYAHVEPYTKHLLLREIASQAGVDLGSTAAVGDTHYDASFLKEAGKGFLIGNPGLARRIGVTPIHDLTELLDLLD